MNKRKGKKGRKAWWHGLLAEWLVMVCLLLKGYRIFRHRYRTPFGEIDIIARKENLFIFVEVKYRTFEAFELPVSPFQKKRITRAGRYVARQFLSDGVSQHSLRFDVFLVKPWKSPVHIKSAWMSDSFET